MDKTNAADLSGGIFAILISVASTTNTKFNHCPSINFVKNRQTATQQTNETLYCTTSLSAISYYKEAVKFSEIPLLHHCLPVFHKISRTEMNSDFSSSKH